MKRWLNTLTQIPDEWSRVTCASPSFIQDDYISKVTEDLMTCGEKEIVEDSNLDITPDVKYRDLE